MLWNTCLSMILSYSRLYHEIDSGSFHKRFQKQRSVTVVLSTVFFYVIFKCLTVLFIKGMHGGFFLIHRRVRWSISASRWSYLRFISSSSAIFAIMS